MSKQPTHVPLYQTKQEFWNKLPFYIFMLLRPFELHRDSRDTREYFIRKFE